MLNFCAKIGLPTLNDVGITEIWLCLFRFLRSTFNMLVWQDFLASGLDKNELQLSKAIVMVAGSRFELLISGYLTALNAVMSPAG
jgi:hypothetical protein